MNKDNFSTFERDLLTPRYLLRIVSSLYEPLGLVAPITIRLRITFRNVFRSVVNLNWDTPLPNDHQSGWLDLIRMLVNAEGITFNRSLKPANTVAACQLICYFDGSDDAFAAAIYIRWKLSDDSIYVSLLCAKPRVTPSKRISTPRSELNGAVLASRLALSTVTSLTNANIPMKRIWFIGDSECILACLEKTNCAFGEYFGNRVGEILDTQAKIERMCPVGKNGEWWHTSSSNNAADQATRSDSVPFDVMPNSRWQQGPEYLRNPTSQWPISRDFSTRKDDCVPSNELLKQFRCLIQKTDSSISFGVEKVIDPMYSNNWRRILRMTQNLL